MYVLGMCIDFPWCRKENFAQLIEVIMKKQQWVRFWSGFLNGLILEEFDIFFENFEVNTGVCSSKMNETATEFYQKTPSTMFKITNQGIYVYFKYKPSFPFYPYI